MEYAYDQDCLTNMITSKDFAGRSAAGSTWSYDAYRGWLSPMNANEFL